MVSCSTRANRRVIMWTKRKRKLVTEGWSREYIDMKRGQEMSRRIAKETCDAQRMIEERLNRQQNKGRATARASG
jgi:hypothetical protein